MDYDYAAPITAISPPNTWIRPIPETLTGFPITVLLLQNYRNFIVVFGYAKTPLEIHGTGTYDEPHP